jgi:hypothetical protein
VRRKVPFDQLESLVVGPGKYLRGDAHGVLLWSGIWGGPYR